MRKEVSTKFILETVQEFNKKEQKMSILEAFRSASTLGTTIYKSKYGPEVKEEPSKEEVKEPETSLEETPKPKIDEQDKFHTMDLNKFYSDEGTDSFKEMWRMLSENLLKSGYSKTDIDKILPEFQKIIQEKVQGRGDLNELKKLVPGEKKIEKEGKNETKISVPTVSAMWKHEFTQEEKKEILEPSNVWTKYYLKELLISEDDYLKAQNDRNPDELVKVIDEERKMYKIPAHYFYDYYDSDQIYKIPIKDQLYSILKMYPKEGYSIQALDKAISNEYKNYVIFKKEREIGKEKDRKTIPVIDLMNISEFAALATKTVGQEIKTALKTLGAKLVKEEK